MKKFWKFLGITALAAALVPYKVEKDEFTGDKTYDALLWHARAKGRASDSPDGRKVDVTFGLKRREEEDWADFDEDFGEDFDMDLNLDFADDEDGLVEVDDEDLFCADDLDDLDDLDDPETVTE